jgi:hypothetical protein
MQSAGGCIHRTGISIDAVLPFPDCAARRDVGLAEVAARQLLTVTLCNGGFCFKSNPGKCVLAAHKNSHSLANFKEICDYLNLV